MVGGYVIEVKSVGEDHVQIWVMDEDADECAVLVEDEFILPELGDNVWWQGKIVLFDNDTRRLRMVHGPYDPVEQGY